ncbi:Gfo/Idh/MocA family protein [Qingshengfaniella alkalisoli]|uniref:Gfo/Idh/MocA family oxidoreductase n=1 Tax=Qingshengfaniella alkalisoli TaxID=2599296 RepID=A0A5B8IXZ8_9RHOB|nr:Gfo/Idh/MocA family oxidoreductase [Qingshengfaniella alkalisoli]QDY70614.1 Gfo/Idh/MocA family oxidoreductase [Qingshengfaniella alkalisoli]
MQKVRYAVVGAGWISQIAFMPAVAQTGNSEITVIVSGNADAARKLADFHDVPHVVPYEDYDKILADDLVDAVYIALPNSMHADYAIRAARAGKHLLVEKPLAISVEECEAMIAAAEEAGVHLMTAYRLHHEPGTVELLEQIRKGAIGDPRIFSSVFSLQSVLGNHRLQSKHWGGPLQDIGVYCLNAARQVFGDEPVEVVAMEGGAEGDPRFTEVAEAVAVTLRFPEGRFAQFVASFGADANDSFQVVGTQGTLTMDPAFKFDDALKMRLRQNEKTVDEISAEQVDHFGAMTAYFSDCIMNGSPPENDGYEGLADVKAMIAIEKAAATGRAQKIDIAPRTARPGPDTVRHIPCTQRRLVL